MPATRQKVEFKVRNTEGNIITVMRRCFGSGKPVQAQIDKHYIYDESKKKFRPAPKEEKKSK